MPGITHKGFQRTSQKEGMYSKGSLLRLCGWGGMEMLSFVHVGAAAKGEDLVHTNLQSPFHIMKLGLQ